MRLFRFFRKRPDKIHAGAETTTSLAHHMEHASEKPFVFQSPPNPAPKTYTVPTYEDHLKGEVQKAKRDFQDALSNDQAQERLDKAELDLKDYRTEIELASKTPFTKRDIDSLKDAMEEDKLTIKNLKSEIDHYSKQFEEIKHEEGLLDGNPLNSAKGRSLDQAIEDLDGEIFGTWIETENSFEKAKDLQTKLDQWQEKFQKDWQKSNEIKVKNSGSGVPLTQLSDRLENDLKSASQIMSELNSKEYLIQNDIYTDNVDHQKDIQDANENYAVTEKALKIAQEIEQHHTLEPFTKDDIKAKEGEFDNLRDLLKEDKLHVDMARADFYCSPTSLENIENAQSYETLQDAEFEHGQRENEIDETQDQISHMTRTLDSNHTKLNDAWNKSNDTNQSEHEPER